MMANESLVELTLVFNDPDLDAEEKDEEVQKLLNQMQNLDEVEESYRVLDPNPPEGNKALSTIAIINLIEAKRQQLIPLVKPILDDLINIAQFWVNSSLYNLILSIVEEFNAIKALAKSINTQEENPC